LDLPGHELGGHPSQGHLLAQAEEPKARGQPRGELRYAVVEVGKPAFDRMPHQHPVGLGVEEVALQEGHDLDVLGPVERCQILHVRW
jgi:hypothetical protein